MDRGTSEIYRQICVDEIEALGGIPQNCLSQSLALLAWDKCCEVDQHGTLVFVRDFALLHDLGSLFHGFLGHLAFTLSLSIKVMDYKNVASIHTTVLVEMNVEAPVRL
jgi:hypothetical protein